MSITDSRETIITKRKYPAGIKGTQYDLYLSNNQVTAKYLVDRIGDIDKVYLELCCGIGITLIELAKGFKKSIGIDNNPETLEFCKENLRNNGVENTTELILDDVSKVELLKSIKADVVLYDIPYWVEKTLPDGTLNLDKNPSLDSMLENISQNISKNIVLFAPKYLKYDDILKIYGECEYQQIMINGKYDRNCIYFGDLIQKAGVSELQLSHD